MTALRDVRELAVAVPTLNPGAVAAIRPPMSREMMLRVVFGLLLGGVGIGVVLAGRWPFALFVAAACFPALREWGRLVQTSSRNAASWLLPAILLAGGVLAAAWFPQSPRPAAFLGAAIVATLLSGGVPTLWSALGPLYIGVPAWCLVLLRADGPHAAWLTLGFFLVIWSADTGALFAGRIIGGPKLLPHLSPQKTWAGLVGGLVTAIAVAAVFALLLHASPLRAAVFALVLAGAAQAGDLFESWVKRHFHRKNSGGLIPGHGGVLDRLDSTLCAAPLAALLFLSFDPMLLLGVRA